MNDDNFESPQSRCARNASHKRFKSRYLLAPIAGGLAFGLILWTVQSMRTAGSHALTRRHFLDIAASLAAYSKVHGHLPAPVRRESPWQSAESRSANATGRPLFSWRVEIVPFLESWHGLWDESKPWNSAPNKQLVELSSFYAYDATAPEGDTKSFPETNAVAITGPGTAFGDGKELPRALNDVPPSTILVVEARASGTPWPAPGDFDIRIMPKTINAPDGKGISSRYAGGFHLIFADGQVWFVSDKVPFETLENFFTVAEAKTHDREKLLGPFTLHRGGRCIGPASIE